LRRGLPGDFVQIDVAAGSRESLFCDRQNALAIALRIGAGFARSGFTNRSGHRNNSCDRGPAPVIILIVETLSALVAHLWSPAEGEKNDESV
jgi:hypothetical protein